jgi:hypothetical protein
MIERRTVVAALIACTTAGASMRALAASLWLDDLTSVELRELIAQGTTIVLLPIGGTEQNGAHLSYRLGRSSNLDEDRNCLFCIECREKNQICK